jgi:protein phosphatase
MAAEIAISIVSRGIARVASEFDVEQLIVDANAHIFEAMRNGVGEPRMGTTLVAASVRGPTALIGNVGDSRAYLIRPDGMLRLTKDHTVNSGHSRYQRHHALTQSLGGLAREMPISPQVLRIEFRPSDALLLCTDGLTDMIEEDEIAAIVAVARDEPAKDLVRAALSAGGRDNVTVILIGPVGEQ